MYDDLANRIVNQWKEEIESIDSFGMRRKVDISMFDIKGNKDGVPCYKVNFNFSDGISGTEYNLSNIDWRDGFDKDWSNKLNKIFFDKFYQKGINDTLHTFIDNGYNSGETSFNNDKVDYMTYQGYRFIVQFYPLGFISEIRNEKLSKLGI